MIDLWPGKLTLGIDDKGFPKNRGKYPEKGKYKVSCQAFFEEFNIQHADYNSDKELI